MSRPKNILFIMCDQLRHDYLGCTGHPTLKTPNIDAMARRGVRFSKAYVQSPICGPSRMSFYTGRYVQSHGASDDRRDNRANPVLGPPDGAAPGVSAPPAGRRHAKHRMGGAYEHAWPA